MNNEQSINKYSLCKIIDGRFCIVLRTDWLEIIIKMYDNNLTKQEESIQNDERDSLELIWGGKDYGKR